MNSIGSWLAENVSHLVLVIDSVIAFVLIFRKSFENRSITTLHFTFFLLFETSRGDLSPWAALGFCREGNVVVMTKDIKP